MNIHFILVEPKCPENVGAAARALKTMGFVSLRLVNPCDYLCDKAKMLAHGSNDILTGAKLYPSLEHAVADMDLVIGTTAKNRLVKFDIYTPLQVRDIIKNKGDTIHHAAIVFGREDRGILSSELRFCDVLSTIPMKAKYPSLNLGQSVMLYACTLSPLSLPTPKTAKHETDTSQLRVLKHTAAEIMKLIGVKTTVANRIMERLATLGMQDIHLVHSVCARVFSRIMRQE